MNIQYSMHATEHQRSSSLAGKCRETTSFFLAETGNLGEAPPKLKHGLASVPAPEGTTAASPGCRKDREAADRGEGVPDPGTGGLKRARDSGAVSMRIKNTSPPQSPDGGEYFKKLSISSLFGFAAVRHASSSWNNLPVFSNSLFGLYPFTE